MLSSRTTPFCHGIATPIVPCVPPRDSSTVTSEVIRKIPDHFMKSLAYKSTLDSLQDALLNHSTTELGVVYDKFCSIIFDELTVKKIRPGGKCIKPWWTPELSLLRKNLRVTLQNWQASKQDKSLKALYTQAQKAFDQAVRWAKRQFIRQQQYSLATSLKSNPKFFWKRWDAISIRNCDKSCTLPKSVIDNKGDADYCGKCFRRQGPLASSECLSTHKGGTQEAVCKGQSHVSISCRQPTFHSWHHS